MTWSLFWNLITWRWSSCRMKKMGRTSISRTNFGMILTFCPLRSCRRKSTFTYSLLIMIRIFPNLWSSTLMISRTNWTSWKLITNRTLGQWKKKSSLWTLLIKSIRMKRSLVLIRVASALGNKFLTSYMLRKKMIISKNGF